jgi:hypothetical protein
MQGGIFTFLDLDQLKLVYDGARNLPRFDQFQRVTWAASAQQPLYKVSRGLRGNSSPHPAHAGAHIDTRTLARGPRSGAGHRKRPRSLVEQNEQPVRNEPRP